jgi:hypothetical protein
MNLYGDLVNPDHGYAVGMTPISFESVADALDTLANIQEQYGFTNLYLGYWQDDDRAYIDVTMVTSSWEMAERLGEKMHQMGVYDFAAEDTIFLAAYYGDQAA